MKNAMEKHNERNALAKQPIGKEEKAMAGSTKFNEPFILREIKLKHGIGCNHGPGSSWCEKYTCF